MSVFQNKANKHRHQTSPSHQRKPETSETRRTLNTPQRVQHKRTPWQYALTRENSHAGCDAECLGVSALPACWSLGRHYSAVLSVPLETVEEMKARLQTDEPETTENQCVIMRKCVFVHMIRSVKCIKSTTDKKMKSLYTFTMEWIFTLNLLLQSLSRDNAYLAKVKQYINV